MVHTAFSDFDHGQALYDAMKKELQAFMDTDTSLEEELAFYREFTEKF